MDVIEFFLCAIGIFYAFAGFVATRAGLTSYFVDSAIAAIAGGKPSKLETAQTYWLLAAASVIFAGGVALVFLLDVAAWLFLASALGQALYLFYVAPRFFDAQEPPDALGRRRSTNAFVIYVVATAFVVWALSRGELSSWDEVAWPYVAIPAALVAAQIGYIVWMLTKLPATAKSPLSAWTSDEASEPGKDPSLCTRVKVMTDYCAYPLWALDEDAYGDFAPEALDLSSELTRDLNEWAEAYTASYDESDPAVSRWTEEEHRAHDAKARPLAARLAREKPDRTFFVMDPLVGVVEVKADEEI
jgi:hypothetical protein